MDKIRPTRASFGVLSLACAVALAGPSPAANAAASVSPTASLPITQAAPKHIVIAMMENEAYPNVVGNRADAPYINGTLIPGGESFTNAHGETHPSLPNYYDLLSGSTQGLINSNPPAAGSINADNLPNELVQLGYTFGSWGDEYTPAQWLRFADIPGTASAPNAMDYWLHCPASVSGQGCGFPTTSAGYAALPTISFVHGNASESMHGSGGSNDTDISEGDTWLEDTLGGYAQWAQANDSLLIVTWDEDYTDSAYDTVPLIYFGAGITAGTTSAAFVNHLSMLRDIESWYGLPKLAMTATGAGAVGAYHSRCLDDSGSGTANGNHIILWGCTGNANQNWTLNGDGTLQTLGKCMDVSGAGSIAGTVVQLWTCNGSVAQQWEADPNGTLRNPHSNMCLDDPSGGTGQQLMIETCTGGATQNFSLPIA